MAIEQEIFKQQMALLADRVGRVLAGPTQVEYYRQLSAELTTEQFVAATTLAFRTWTAEFRNWPSPQQLIALIAPVSRATLSALEAFERVLSVTNNSAKYPDMAARREGVQALGQAVYRAFLAAGGLREFTGVLETDVPWLRKRFVEAYEAAAENVEAEQQAQLALGDADLRVAALIADVAKVRQMPVHTGPKRISA